LGAAEHRFELVLDRRKGFTGYRFARQRVTHAVRADMFPNDIAA
jgi:hypothetical protein